MSVMDIVRETGMYPEDLVIEMMFQQLLPAGLSDDQVLAIRFLAEEFMGLGECLGHVEGHRCATEAEKSASEAKVGMYL